VSSTGERVELPSKVPYRKIRKGERLIALGPNGGGYGDPLMRAPEGVLDNVRDGLVSVDRARDLYGVEIVGDEIDRAATARLRADKRLRTT
jgi:N-methylhydantoinase B